MRGSSLTIEKRGRTLAKKAAGSGKKKAGKKAASASKPKKPKKTAKKNASGNVAMDVRIDCVNTGIACTHNGAPGYYHKCGDLGLVCIPNVTSGQAITVTKIHSKNDGAPLETIRATFTYQIGNNPANTRTLEGHQGIKTTPVDWKN